MGRGLAAGGRGCAAGCGEGAARGLLGTWGRTHLPGRRPPGAPCGRRGLGGARAAAASPSPGAPAAAAATRPQLPAQRIGAAAGGPRRQGGARGAGRAAAPGPGFPQHPPPGAPQHRCGPAPPRARPLPAQAPRTTSPADLRGCAPPGIRRRPPIPGTALAPSAPPARSLLPQPRQLPSICSPPDICGVLATCRRLVGGWRGGTEEQRRRRPTPLSAKQRMADCDEHRHEHCGGAGREFNEAAGGGRRCKMGAGRERAPGGKARVRAR